MPGVADVWGRDSEERLKMLVSPEQLRTQLARVRRAHLPGAVMWTPELFLCGSWCSMHRIPSTQLYSTTLE